MLVLEELWVSRADTAEPLEVLARGPVWHNVAFWLCRGVNAGIPADQAASCCSCDGAPPTCVPLLLLDCKDSVW